MWRRRRGRLKSKSKSKINNVRMRKIQNHIAQHI